MGGDGSGIDAGLIGLFLLIGLFVVCGLLGWSMIRHVRNVPASFDPPEGGDATPAPARAPRARAPRGGATRGSGRR